MSFNTETIWTIENNADAEPRSISLPNAIATLGYEFNFTSSYITKCLENGESFITRKARYSADRNDLMQMWQKYHGETK